MARTMRLSLVLEMPYLVCNGTDKVLAPFSSWDMFTASRDLLNRTSSGVSVLCASIPWYGNVSLSWSREGATSLSGSFENGM